MERERQEGCTGLQQTLLAFGGASQLDGMESLYLRILHMLLGC